MKEEDDFIEEVQVKVPPGHVVFGSKRSESQGPNKMSMMTPLTKLDSKQITNLSDSPFEDENHFNTDQKEDAIGICEEDSHNQDSSPVYSDHGGADLVRESLVVMQQKLRPSVKPFDNEMLQEVGTEEGSSLIHTSLIRLNPNDAQKLQLSLGKSEETCREESHFPQMDDSSMP